MRKLPKRICVLDLETSGSFPDWHLLEIGMVMLESDGLTELSRFQSVVLPTGIGAGTIDTVRDDADEVVREMHDKNSLWDDLREAEVIGGHWEPEVVDEKAARWLRGVTLDSTAHVALAGSGVSHFDRPFIRRDLPKLDRLFTYWAYDVGVMRRLLALAGAESLQPTFDAGAAKTHRALDDALVHADELRHYVTTMRRMASIDSYMSLGGT